MPVAHQGLGEVQLAKTLIICIRYHMKHNSFVDVRFIGTPKYYTSVRHSCALRNKELTRKKNPILLILIQRNTVFNNKTLLFSKACSQYVITSGIKLRVVTSFFMLTAISQNQSKLPTLGPRKVYEDQIFVL